MKKLPDIQDKNIINEENAIEIKQLINNLKKVKAVFYIRTITDEVKK